MMHATNQPPRCSDDASSNVAHCDTLLLPTVAHGAETGRSQADNASYPSNSPIQLLHIEHNIDHQLAYSSDIKSIVDELVDDVSDFYPGVYQNHTEEAAAAPEMPHHGADSRKHLTTTRKVVNSGRWTAEEHRLFLEALQKHGKEWKCVASHVKSRTQVQVRTHAQKYFKKLAKARQNGESVEGGTGVIASAVPNGKIEKSGAPIAEPSQDYNQPIAHVIYQPQYGNVDMPSDKAYDGFHMFDPSIFSQAYEQAYIQGFVQGAATESTADDHPLERSNSSFVSIPSVHNDNVTVVHASYRPTSEEFQAATDMREELVPASKRMKMEDKNTQGVEPN
ncbi:hypothetical protein ACHAXR_010337 [Thalassiosira sp. AJA248-18]